MRNDILEAELIRSIVGGFFAVYNYYGYGLVEAAYAGALTHELADRGHRVVRELSIEIMYMGRHVAWQRLDMVVDDKVVVECKATELLPPYAKRQVLGCLRASTYQVGLVLHFGPEPKFHRLVDSFQPNSAHIREHVANSRHSRHSRSNEFPLDPAPAPPNR